MKHIEYYKLTVYRFTKNDSKVRRNFSGLFYSFICLKSTYGSNQIVLYRLLSLQTWIFRCKDEKAIPDQSLFKLCNITSGYGIFTFKILKPNLNNCTPLNKVETDDREIVFQKFLQNKLNILKRKVKTGKLNFCNWCLCNILLFHFYPRFEKNVLLSLSQIARHANERNEIKIF